MVTVKGRKTEKGSGEKEEKRRKFRVSLTRDETPSTTKRSREKWRRTGRILNVLVGESSLEIGYGSRASGRVGHNLESLVDETLLEELAEDPPARRRINKDGFGQL